MPEKHRRRRTTVAPLQREDVHKQGGLDAAPWEEQQLLEPGPGVRAFYEELRRANVNAELDFVPGRIDCNTRPLHWVNGSSAASAEPPPSAAVTQGGRGGPVWPLARLEEVIERSLQRAKLNATDKAAVKAALVALAGLVVSRQADKVVFAGRISKISLVMDKPLAMEAFALMIYFRHLVAARVAQLVDRQEAARKVAALSSLGVALARRIIKAKISTPRLRWTWPQSIAVTTIVSN